MLYYLSGRAALRWLEKPSIYNIAGDELYELDDESFRFLKACAAEEGCAAKDSPFIDYCLGEGLLQKERTIASRPVLVQAPVPSLRYLELQITDSCNLRCAHCSSDDAGRHELSPEQVRLVLSEFEAMQGLRVLISGGEPLVHQEFDRINEMLPDFLLRKVLFTNGVLLGKEKLKALKVDEIQVSIDGLEAGHDALRGPGMYDRSMRAVHDALDAGFSVSISTMVHSRNLADFDSLELLFKTLGIKDWSVEVPCAEGRLNIHEDLLVTPEAGGKYLGYGFGGGTHSAGRGFGCGLHLLTVTAAGKTAKCSFYADRSAGTIGQGLAAAWRKVKPVHLSELSCSCEYLEVCRGGCRYRAELAEGPGERIGIGAGYTASPERFFIRPLHNMKRAWESQALGKGDRFRTDALCRLAREDLPVAEITDELSDLDPKVDAFYSLHALVRIPLFKIRGQALVAAPQSDKVSVPFFVENKAC